MSLPIRSTRVTALGSGCRGSLRPSEGAHIHTLHLIGPRLSSLTSGHRIAPYHSLVLFVGRPVNITYMMIADKDAALFGGAHRALTSLTLIGIDPPWLMGMDPPCGR